MSRIQVNFRNFTILQKIAEYALLFVISVIFITVFSLWTSPFYRNWYGCDASFFTLVGRGITQGKIMYRDFYDLKGPYFFFLQALGQLLIKGRMGAFWMQCLSLYASVILIYNTSLLYVNKAKSSFILFVFFLGHIATLWGGNTLEEYYLPLSLLCLFLVCRNLKDDSLNSSKHLPFLLGIVLGVMFFSKISIAGTVLGIIAALIFLKLSRRQYAELLIFTLYVILGILFASVPVIVYYATRESLFDMLNCVFITGFKRAGDYAEMFNVTWELKCSGAVLSFVFAVTHKNRIGRDLSTILMAISAATYLLLHLGTPFYYYFASVYPCLILALALMLKTYDPLIIFESGKQALCLVIFSVYIIYYVTASLATVKTVLYNRNEASYQTYYDDSKAIASLIPESERDEVFSFMLDMQWYEINNILPCNRYVVNLPFFIALDENVLPELTEYLNNTPPKWLVIGYNFQENLPELSAIVYQKYDNIYSNTVGSLYLLR